MSVYEKLVASGIAKGYAPGIAHALAREVIRFRVPVVRPR